VTEKKTNERGEEKEYHTSQTTSYVSLQQLTQMKWNEVIKSYGKRQCSTAQLFLAIQLVLQFGDVYGRWPDTQQQIDIICEMKEKKLKEEGIAPDTLPLPSFKSFLNVCDCELAPVCCIFGAIVAQEILKVISGNEAPLKNVVTFDANTGSSFVQSLPP